MKQPDSVISLRRLEEKSAQQLSASQVIVSLSACVKELVDNSLDAGTSLVAIRLTDGGLSAVEVEDHGAGIPLEELDLLCAPYATSKIKSYRDIGRTLGFRGEALHALCLAGDLSVQTRTSRDAPCFKATYDADGTLKARESGQKLGNEENGTTVRIEALFSRMPVRRRELEKNKRLQLASLLRLLTEYAIIRDDVAFEVTAVQSSTHELKRLLATSGRSEGTRSLLKHFFGKQLAEGMQEIRFDCEATSVNHEKDWEAVGFFLPPARCHRTVRKLAMISVNRRPVTTGVKRIASGIKQAYRQLTSARASSPQYVLLLKIAEERVDINVTPDKLSIYIVNEVEIARAIEQGLICQFSSQVATQRVIAQPSQLIPDGSQSTILPETPPVCQPDGESDPKEESHISNKCYTAETTNAGEYLSGLKLTFFESKVEAPLETNPVPKAVSPRRAIFSLSQESDHSPIARLQLSDLLFPKDGLSPEQRLENRESSVNTWTPLRSVDELVIRETFEESLLSAVEHSSGRVNDLEMSDVIRFPKDLFQKMRIIGQLNRGFIICSLDLANEHFPLHHYLFVIDQHASDEIARFEKLQKTRQITRQRLIDPIKLHLSPAEKLTTLTFQSVFEANGFSIEGDDLLLTTLPVVYGHHLGLDDFHNLLSQLMSNDADSQNRFVENSQRNDPIFDDSTEESPQQDLPMTYPQRVREILASKACRSAVMIGEALTHKHMEKLVRTMSHLERPWNCPHGRPTIRHLITL